MYCYGWIPILTSKLAVQDAIRKLKRDVVSTSPENEFILNHKIDQNNSSKPTNSSNSESFRKDNINYFSDSIRDTIKSHLKSSSDDLTFFYMRDFDDEDSSKLERVAVVIDKKCYVKSIGIFGSEEEPLSIRASARVDLIESTGLVQYQMLQGDFRVGAKQLFGEIRDIYHEHIYAPHGDFPLRPVSIKNCDRDEVIELIFKQYRKKIISYHSSIKFLMSKLEQGYGDKSPADYDRLSTIFLSAQGEMVYALSFINLFNLPAAEEKSIRNSLESLRVLNERFKNLIKFKEVVVNWKIGMLSYLGAVIAGLQLAYMIKSSFSIYTILIPSLTFALFYYVVRKFRYRVSTIKDF